MSRKNKILLGIFIIIIISFLYFLFTTEEIIFENENQPISTSSEEMLSVYKDEMKLLVNELIENIENDNLTINNIQDVKNKLTRINTPSEYKEMHMNIFLAVNQLQSYFDEDIGSKDDAYDIIMGEASKNNWLVE